MNEMMNIPPKIILDRVKREWEYIRPKNLLKRLISLIIIRPVAIEIVQTEIFDERTNICTGVTLNRWRYDDVGLQSLPTKEDSEQQPVEYYYFCIDKEKKKLAVARSCMLEGAFKGSKITYPYHYGWVFEIVEHNGIEDYKQISCWIE